MQQEEGSRAVGHKAMEQDMDPWGRTWGKISCYGSGYGIMGRIWARSIPKAMRMRMEEGKAVWLWGTEPRS